MEHSLDFCYKGEKRKLLINSRIELTNFVGCYKDKILQNVTKYNFQSIIVNLTQSKQKSKLCGLFIGLL